MNNREVARRPNKIRDHNVYLSLLVCLEVGSPRLLHTLCPTFLPRIVQLEPPECTALKRFLEGKGTKKDSKYGRTQIKKYCEKAGYPYLPPTELRALYEFHIRFVEKKPLDQIKQEMKEIGHTVKTGMQYGWRYFNLVKLMEDEPELFG